MGFWGGFFGGALGGSIGGPIGFLIGAYLGNKITNGGDSPPLQTNCPHCGKEQSNPENNSILKCTSCSTVYLYTNEEDSLVVNIVGLAAKIAKADGRVSPEEIAVVDQFLTRSQFEVEERKFLAGRFNRMAVETAIGYEVYLQRIKLFTLSDAQKISIMRLVAELIGSSSQLRSLLDEIARELAIPEEEFKRLCSLYVGGLKCPFCLAAMKGDIDIIQTCPSCSQAFFQGVEKNNNSICTVALAAIMSKADGQVSKREIDFIDDMLTNRMEHTVPEGKFLANLFNTYTKSQLNASDYITTLQTFSTEFRNGVFVFLFELSSIDGTVSDKQKKLLQEIAQSWKIEEELYNECIDEFWNKPDIDSYYHTLGCLPGAPWDVIKKSYRELVNLYHPDKHATVKQTAAQKAALHKKFVEIQEAYEKIKEHYEAG